MQIVDSIFTDSCTRSLAGLGEEYGILLSIKKQNVPPVAILHMSKSASAPFRALASAIWSCTSDICKLTEMKGLEKAGGIDLASD